jgi:hypothetical protein
MELGQSCSGVYGVGDGSTAMVVGKIIWMSPRCFGKANVSMMMISVIREA